MKATSIEGLLKIAAIIVLAVFGYNLIRLLPESSPIARASSDPVISTCLQCHGQPNKSLNDHQLTCPAFFTRDKPIGLKHPHYTGQCKDYLAYFIALKLAYQFDERARLNGSNRLLQGEMLARQFYCFQCHGELGQGGYPNQKSLKGYIPGYFGRDFRSLTNNGSRASVREWLQTGSNSRLTENLFYGWIAEYFLQRQMIHMPNFGSLSDEELELLVDYVLTLQSLGSLDEISVKQYEALTNSEIEMIGF